MKPTSKISFKIVVVVVGALLKILIRRKVKGKENLPPNGAIIAVCNHVHLVDPLIHIISILPRDSIFMAKEELFRTWPMPLFPLLMNIAEAYPVHRRGTLEEREEALRKAEKVLAEGLVFGIYPEGTRSRTAKLKTAYHGVAKIALGSGAPLIPVGIYGTEKLKGIGWISRPEVTVSFGKPFNLPIVGAAPTNSQFQELTGFIMEQLCTVLPPEYHGRYGKQSSPDPNLCHDNRD